MYSWVLLQRVLLKSGSVDSVQGCQKDGPEYWYMYMDSGLAIHIVTILLYSRTCLERLFCWLYKCGLSRQVVLDLAPGMWSFKTGGLSWAWSIQTGFTVWLTVITFYFVSIQIAINQGNKFDTRCSVAERIICHVCKEEYTTAIHNWSHLHCGRCEMLMMKYIQCYSTNE